MSTMNSAFRQALSGCSAVMFLLGMMLLSWGTAVEAKPSRPWDSATQRQRNDYIVELALKQVGFQYPGDPKEWVKEIVFSASQYGLPQRRAIVLPETLSSGYEWKASLYIYTPKKSQLIKAALPGQVIQMKWKDPVTRKTSAHTAIVGDVSSKTITFLDVSPDPKRKSRNLVQKRRFAYTEVERAVGSKFTIYEIQGGPEPKSKDNRIVLQWPLGSVTRHVNYPNDHDGGSFGSDWNDTFWCGLIKKHTGTDYRADVGDAVYAPEDGLVKEESSAGSGWARRIVIEHDHPTGKYTTLLMHVEPEAGIRKDIYVTKGKKVAKIAYLATGKHLHFGIRKGAYHSTFSGRGSLPQVGCHGDPAFPENFIDPGDTSKVLFK